MACNLAVAITKAALTDERLKALIDTHLDQVTEIMAKYLHRTHPKVAVASGQPGTGLVHIGGMTLAIVQGQVSITGSRRASTTLLMKQISDESAAFLKLVADQLFSQEVERALKQASTLTGKHTADVENAGVVQRATVYSIQINGLKARVFVLPHGRLQVFVDTGTFEQAKTATLRLFQQVQAQALGIQMVSEIEQHRADVDHVHVRQAHQRGDHSW